MIYKVLILGTDSALQAGFLHRASGNVLSYRLYLSLGVGIGVARVSLGRRADLTLQLWSIPSRERWPGLTDNFTKGQRGRLVVMVPEDITNLPRILPGVCDWPKVPSVFVFVGDPSEEEIMNLSSLLKLQIDVQRVESIDEVLLRLGEMMVETSIPVKSRTLALSIDPSECPSATPEMVMDAGSMNTDEEVEHITKMAIELGIETKRELCSIPLTRGTAQVSMRTGSVQYTPTICDFCANSCIRSANICIVNKDTGWSSSRLSERALLTMAKIQALALGAISNDVKDKLDCASQCSNFQMASDCDSDDEGFLAAMGYSMPHRVATLLDAAERRVKEGKLGPVAYDTLKRGLLKAKSRKDD